MKAIRKQVRSTDLDNAAQMNKVDGKIFERNPDTGEIDRSYSIDTSEQRQIISLTSYNPGELYV